jgi:hypothetical protein
MLTLNVYPHVVEDAKKEAMNVMSRIIKAKKTKCDIKCDIEKCADETG